jgi:hypothetical protein
MAIMRPLSVKEMNIALFLQHGVVCFGEIELKTPSSFAPVL